MIALTIIPLVLMALINYHQYQSSLKEEIVGPTKLLANKNHPLVSIFFKRTPVFDEIHFLFFIPGIKLCDEKTLNHILYILKKEFVGFVDSGSDQRGRPEHRYAMRGRINFLEKTDATQSWFHEVTLKGTYISDVFLGYRKFPHIAIAVQRLEADGQSWIVRTTIHTTMFDNLIAAMGLDSESRCICSQQGGCVPDQFAFVRKGSRAVSHPNSLRRIFHICCGKKRSQWNRCFFGLRPLTLSRITLVIAKPHSAVLKAWYALKSDLVVVFSVSSALILIVVFRLTDILVSRIREADQRRELAFRELQHSHKLSFIGRLAAGVAHEVNNPLAIINEKAGLIKDLIEYTPDFAQKRKISKPFGIHPQVGESM